jgi:hypothetical protein
LFNRFRYCAHTVPRAALRRHATKSLQAFSENARMTINVPVKLAEDHG